MANIVLLFACLVLGVALRKSGRAPPQAHLALNAFVIHISLPALILLQVHGIALEPKLAIIVAMPWILFAMAAATFFWLGRRLNLTLQTVGALILTAGLANTSFVGLPMIETYFGPSYLWVGILIDQLGTYLVLSTLGVSIAAAIASSKIEPKAIALRIVTFPPFVALVVALILFKLPYPDIATTLLKRLGDTLAPIALVSVGLQLNVADLQGNRRELALGLGFKLLLAPLAVALIYFVLFRQTDPTGQVTVFESAMGPQIGGAIIATQNQLNPRLVALMVGAGISLSFLTLPLWSLVLHAA